MDTLNKNASTRTRPVVYIASPYTKGDPAINTHFQCRVFNQLMDDGIVWPVVPLWTHFQHTVFPRKYQDWIDYDLALLDRYDACIRLDAVVPALDYKSTESSGADGEAAAFAAMGKPVFRSVEDCYAWVAARNQSPTQTPASERRTAGFSETGGCLVADLLTDDQQWAVLRAMNSLELKERGDCGHREEELDNKAVSILCALVCQKQTSDAVCVPHADKSSCRPDAPPDVTQPDNGSATSGRGPKTAVEAQSPCLTFSFVRNDITIFRAIKPWNYSSFTWTDRRVVHDYCRQYKCDQCGDLSRPLRNGRDLRKWWRKHRAKTKAAQKPDTAVEELPMPPNENTAPAVWGYDIVDKLADHTAVTMFDVDAAREEILKLREALVRLAVDAGGMLAVQSGNVTVTIDTTLTDAERVAIAWAVEVSDSLAECGGAGISPGATNKTSATLRGLLARANGPATLRGLLARTKTHTQPASWIDEEIACEAAFDRSGAPHDWPDDEPATVTRMSLSMSAECVRLREEVKRLRLTDSEREAVAYFGLIDGPCYLPAANTHAATLRGLLARLDNK